MANSDAVITSPFVNTIINRFIRDVPIYIGIMVIVLNDWRFGSLSFSDFFILAGISVLFPSITKVPVRWLISCGSSILLVLVNILIASSLGGYSLASGLFYLLKISMYILFYVLLYFYVIKRHMILEFIKALINVAVVVSLLGLLIALLIATDSSLSYNFLWTFTRQDIASYIFSGGYSSVVRVRSIFGEPQHLGLFLNITLASALLGNYSKNIRRNKSLAIIISAAFMTFSFSTIPVTLIILLLYFIKRYKLAFFFKKNFIMILAIIICLSVLMWQPINETIYQSNN